jgi:ABC-type Zn uptake system ZnuABC Zn-binding protein ZnuA
MKRLVFLTIATILFSTCLVACQPGTAETPPSGTSGESLQVGATTSILANVVNQVAGEGVQVSVLVPPGSDPHSFQPAPQDIRAIAEADLVFINGAGLEPFMDRLVDSGVDPAEKEKVISVSEGINFRRLPAGAAEAGQEEEQNQSGEGEVDPHVWTDPRNVAVWVENIERALAQADPANAKRYAANAQAYRAELEALQAWIEEQVAAIPPGNRKLVTDHDDLGYFADRYGFELIGTVIPGASAAASPSAEDLAALLDAVQAQGVKAVFVGTTVSPQLAERLAADAGIRLVSIYTDSLTPPGGEASTYLELMRYDVNAIREALQ